MTNLRTSKPWIVPNHKFGPGAFIRNRWPKNSFGEPIKGDNTIDGSFSFYAINGKQFCILTVAYITDSSSEISPMRDLKCFFKSDDKTIVIDGSNGRRLDEKEEYCCVSSISFIIPPKDAEVIFLRDTIYSIRFDNMEFEGCVRLDHNHLPLLFSWIVDENNLDEEETELVYRSVIEAAEEYDNRGKMHDIENLVKDINLLEDDNLSLLINSPSSIEIIKKLQDFCKKNCLNSSSKVLNFIKGIPSKYDIEAIKKELPKANITVIKKEEKKNLIIGSAVLMCLSALWYSYSYAAFPGILSLFFAVYALYYLLRPVSKMKSPDNIESKLPKEIARLVKDFKEL